MRDESKGTINEAKFGWFVAGMDIKGAGFRCWRRTVPGDKLLSTRSRRRLYAVWSSRGIFSRSERETMMTPSTSIWTLPLKR